MKKLVFFLFFASFVPLIMAQTFSSYTEAAEAQKKYTPVYMGKFKPLSLNEDTVRFTGIFHGQTANGIKFAWLEDELVVINKTTKKTTRIYRCGNSGEFWSNKTEREEKYIPLSMLSQIQIPGPKGEKGDKGDRGLPGKDRIVESSFSFWQSIWPYVIGGGILAILVEVFWPHHQEAAATSTTAPPTHISDGGILPPN